MKIETDEQYQSVKELGQLLEDLGLTEDFVGDLIFSYGAEFEECDDCGNKVGGCNCDDYRPNPYSDDDSFE